MTPAETALAAVMNCGAADAGILPIARLGRYMSAVAQSRAARELPGARSLICAVFPYFAGFHGGNISLYARGRDYHSALGARLEWVAQGLSDSLPGHHFKVYVDASPYPEVRAAAMCGLGAIGRSGLLLTPRHGSLVFIGTIAATLPGAEAVAPAACEMCGKCIRACPNGAVTSGGIDVTRCVSAITQKRGALSENELEAVSRAGMLWGCDACQKACPHNRDIPLSTLGEFTNDLIFSLTPGDVELSQRDFDEKYRDRAFAWRGVAPLRRNMNIINK